MSGVVKPNQSGQDRQAVQSFIHSGPTQCDARLTHKGTTVCPRISDPVYIISYYMKWVTTSWTDGT